MRTKLCEKCNHEYTLCNFNTHYQKCNGKINYWKRKVLGIVNADVNVDEPTQCKFCNRIGKNLASNKQHQLVCKNNPDRQIKKPSYGMRGKKGSNQHIKGTAKPHSEKLLDFYKNHNKTNPNGVATNDSLRWKRKEYPATDSFGDQVILESKNEVRFANLCDELKVRWTKAKRFKLSNGSSYAPDFYLVDYDIYTDPKSMFWLKNFNHSQQEKINLFEKEYNTKLIIFWDTEASSWKKQLSDLLVNNS